MSVTLGISALFLQPGKVGGAEFMLKNLVDGLNAIRQPSDRLQVFSNTRWPICGSQAGVDWINGWGTGNRFILEWKALRRAAGALDAMLFTNYFTPPARTAKHPRLVTVIHDLQYLHFPQHFTLQKRLWLRCAHELTLRRADRVVVISNFVRQDLLAHYGARWESKVQVIPNPISFDRFDDQATEPEATPGVPAFDLRQQRYILSVAAHYPHKNLTTLIRAFDQLRRRQGFDDVRLVLAGQWGKRLIGAVPGVDLAGLIEELGIEDAVTITGHISDAALGQLYRHAAVFAFPSLFEGFGMPAVEALGFGMPVVTTKCGALPETTLGLAHYLDDPLDASQWASALAMCLAQPGSYRLSPQERASIRDRYRPDRIGRAYYQALVGP